MPEWGMEDTRRNVARSLRDTFPDMFGSAWMEAKDVFYRSFEAVHLSHLRPLPGAEEMLASLVDMDLDLAVVSNKVGHYLRVEADQLGWSRYFKALVGATDAPADKPDPAPVDMALSATGRDRAPLSADRAWFVGDSAVDLQCAINSGCRPILLRPDPPGPTEFSEYAPFRYLSCCAELAALVHELPVPISGN
jgi:phosphoglycolate phosphatase